MKIIVDKAIKYSGRGVIGIDIAGPESETIELRDGIAFYKECSKLRVQG